MNPPFDHIITKQAAFTGANGLTYTIDGLVRDVAIRHRKALLAIHNLIPHVAWNEDDLTRDNAPDGTTYHERWRLSLVVRCEGGVAGLLIAYVRAPSDRHPMASIYIHRLAISVVHQRQGLGTNLLGFAVAAYFRAAPWLLTVSVQTNDDTENLHVLRLYNRLNFRLCYKVHYRNKRDRLLEVSRAEHLAFAFPIRGKDRLTVPPYSPSDIQYLSDPLYNRGTLSAGIVHFGTGSIEKREQYRHLLRCYGLELMPLSTRVSLSEPQVEGVGSSAESNLVTAPLKLYSRFAALSDTYPFVVEDTMLFIEHFNEDYDNNPILPGADTKRWWRSLGISGLLRVLSGSTFRRAMYVCQIGIALKSGRYEYYRHSLSGTISLDERRTQGAISNFPYTNATFFHAVFIPSGSERTLAEMEAEEFVKWDYRRKCLEACIPALRAAAVPDLQQPLFPLNFIA